MNPAKGNAALGNLLMNIYRHLLKRFGAQRWWPAQTPFEVMVGAILTQNTAWTNVEKAIENLKGADVLDPQTIAKMEVSRLAALIRPAGYFNIKAKRLQNLCRFLASEEPDYLKRLKSKSLKLARKKLLAVDGVGPETADSILLCALGKSSFVVDAYTRRVLSRHKVIREDTTYEEIKSIFEKNFKRRVALFNEYHALFVAVGKNYCRPRPLCGRCPLNEPRFYLLEASSPSF